MSDRERMSNLMSGIATELFFVAAKNSAQMSQMHNTRLETENEGEDEEDGGDEDIYEVDFLMDMKIKKGKRFFYVRWKGFDETYDSWEPEENLEGAKEEVNKFLITFKPKTKGGRPTKPAAATSLTPGISSKSDTSTKSSARKRGRPPHNEGSDQDATPQKDSDDEEYGQRKARRMKSNEKASSSEKTPTTSTYTSVPALNNCIKRRINMNTGLRWLESDSNSSHSSDNEGPSMVNAVLKIVPPPVFAPLTVSEDASGSLPVPVASCATDDDDTHTKHKEKDKKKKKKSKKHTKNREKSKTPSSPVIQAPSTENNNPTIEKRNLTFLGAYHPEGANRGDFRFVVRDTESNQEYTLSLGEAFLADSWHLCRYLASKIQFQADGKQRIEFSHENGDLRR